MSKSAMSSFALAAGEEPDGPDGKVARAGVVVRA
jgi:hypothetical protein